MFDPKARVEISGGQPAFNQGRDFNTYIYLNGEGGKTAFGLLTKNVVTSAFHNGGERCDAPKCHPGTREAILTRVMAWAAAVSYIFSIQWIHGPAGSGKSSILRTLSDMFEGQGLLLASFFFCRTAAGRNTADLFISTIAYQICRSLPQTRRYIEAAIEHDPLIFSQSLEAQAQALIILPLTRAHQECDIPSACPRVIVVDGLDECRDGRQCDILRVLNDTVQKLPVPLAILIASRPEPHIRHAFNVGELNKASSRLTLDESYEPDKDIRKYYKDKFHDICHHHPLKSSLPESWPSEPIIDLLVEKASGQFILASTAIRFIEPHRHDPSQRLNMLIGPTSPGNPKPFEQLDALYSTILANVDADDINRLLHLLGVVLVSHTQGFHCSENFQSMFFLERLGGVTPSEIRRLLFDLGSLLEIKDPENTHDFDSFGLFQIETEKLHVYHASFADFLFDEYRSGRFFIDSAVIYKSLAKQCIDLLFSTPDYSIKDYIEVNLGFHLQQANFSSQDLALLLAAFTPEKIFQVKMPCFDYLWISCVLLPEWLHSLQNVETEELCSWLLTAHKAYVQSKVDVYFEQKLTPLLILALEGFGEDSPFQVKSVFDACFEDFFPVWDKNFVIQSIAQPDIKDGFSFLRSMVTLVRGTGCIKVLYHLPSHFHNLLLECIGIRLGNCYADFSMHILNWLVLHTRPATISSPLSSVGPHVKCLEAAATLLPHLLSKSALHPDIAHLLGHLTSDFTAHDKVQKYLLRCHSNLSSSRNEPSLPKYLNSVPSVILDEIDDDITITPSTDPAQEHDLYQLPPPTFHQIFLQAWLGGLNPQLTKYKRSWLH